MNQLVVKNTPISIKDGYYSLTDIAKDLSGRPPNEAIRSWLKNQSTLAYLQEWEIAYNVKHVQMNMFNINDLSNDDKGITIKRYIERGGTGIISTSGRYGGTYAHITIALNFTTWLKPRFAVWFFSEWVQMKEQQMRLNNNEWMLDKIISNSIENANLAESIKEMRRKK